MSLYSLFSSLSILTCQCLFENFYIVPAILPSFCHSLFQVSISFFSYECLPFLQSICISWPILPVDFPQSYLPLLLSSNFTSHNSTCSTFISKWSFFLHSLSINLLSNFLSFPFQFYDLVNKSQIQLYYTAAYPPSNSLPSKFSSKAELNRIGVSVPHCRNPFIISNFQSMHLSLSVQCYLFISHLWR